MAKRGEVAYAWRKMEMLTIKDAAAKAGVSETTMRRWLSAKVVRYVRPLPKGMILIPEEALRRVLEPK